MLAKICRPRPRADQDLTFLPNSTNPTTVWLVILFLNGMATFYDNVSMKLYALQTKFQQIRFFCNQKSCERAFCVVSDNLTYCFNFDCGVDVIEW